MKRLFVSAALLPLAIAAAANAETKVTTAVTAPVKTSTATAAGAPDDLTVDTAGSVKPTAAGAAVTLDSNNAVKNLGAIGFNNLNDATGILVLGGRTGSVSNGGQITVLEDYTPTDTDGDGDLDGAFAQGTNRFGVHVTGPAAFTGNIRNELGSGITVEGADSAGVAIDTQLNGALFHGGSISVVGDRSVGLRAGTVTGSVQIVGAIGVQGEGASALVLDNVGGQLLLQNAISATGYRSTTRLDDATRAKLDADDLKQGGAAVRITGDVAAGIILDKPPADNDTNNADEDTDGIPDASESTAAVTSFGSAPALDIGSGRATTVGLLGVGENAYGIAIRGIVAADGVNDAVSAVALRIGQAGGGTTTITNGINVQGGTISANAYGQSSIGLLINAAGVVPALKNTGVIVATQVGGLHDARAVVDLSGSLRLVENQGLIRGALTVPTGVTSTGQAVALDLRANTTGVTVRQTKLASTSVPSIVGDVLLGSGDDRVDILGGTVTGTLSFGTGADQLNIDGAAVVTGRLADADGRLALSVAEGTLALANVDTVQLSALTLGAKSKLVIALDPTTAAVTRLNVSGAANIVSGAEIDFTLSSILKTATSFEVVRAGALTVGTTGVALVGAPFLYTAALKTNAATGSLSVDLKPKTAAELGLNRSETQAYSAVFAALGVNDTIENAVLAQTTQGGFQAVYDQMLPDHSGGALLSAQAISGAINAAASGTAIRSKSGDYAVWAQEIYFQIERDRDQALGFKSQAMGLAAGVETLGQYNALGLNVSLVTDEYKDKGSTSGERVVMNFLEGGLYWRVDLGGFRADARAGLGYVSFDSDRRFTTPASSLSAAGKWNGWLAEAHAGAAYEARLGWFVAKPELTVDYLRLSEGGYTETGGGAGFDLTVKDRKGDLLTGQALLTIGGHFGEEAWIQPEVTVGYRAKLAGDAGSTTANFAGGSAFTLAPEDIAAGGTVVRLGLRGGTDMVAYSLHAGSTFDAGYKEYDVRAAVRFAF